MRTALRWTCLWPGLPGLWREGQVRSLALAIGFAALLNLALVATFVWPGILTTSGMATLWSLLALGWGISAWNSHRYCQRARSLPNSQARDAQFRQVQTHYLKGHWPEAESQLKELIGGDPGDIEAHLYLATLYRRTERPHEAQQVLDGLERLALERPEGVHKWRTEIARERQQLIANLAPTQNQA